MGFWPMRARVVSYVYYKYIYIYIYIYIYVITQVILAFWLVLTYDVLEDRRIDDVIIKIVRLSLPGQATLDSNLILRNSLNQSQFFAKHGNQSVRFILYRQ